MCASFFTETAQFLDTVLAAFSALTLLAGIRKRIRPVKIE